MNDPRKPSVVEQVAPLTGMAAVALVVVTVIDVGPPPPITRIVQIPPHFAQHGDSMVIESVLLGFAWMLFLWFAASLRAQLRANEPEPGRLSSMSFASATVVSALGIGSAVTLAASAALPTEGMGGAYLLLHLGRMLQIFIGVPAAAMILASSLSALRYGGLPKVLAQAGAVLAAAAVVLVALLANDPDLVNGVAVSSMVFMLWVGWTSVVLYRGRGQTSRA